jgi:hypothetical protein
MHPDRGGMGSHKHGVSGRPGPRPALKRFHGLLRSDVWVVKRRSTGSGPRPHLFGRARWGVQPVAELPPSLLNVLFLDGDRLPLSSAS